MIANESKPFSNELVVSLCGNGIIFSLIPFLCFSYRYVYVAKLVSESTCTLYGFVVSTAIKKVMLLVQLKAATNQKGVPTAGTMIIKWNGVFQDQTNLGLPPPQKERPSNFIRSLPLQLILNSVSEKWRIKILILRLMASQPTPPTVPPTK